MTSERGTINKVILVGEVQYVDVAASYFILLTYEVNRQKGQRVEHVEEHTIRFPRVLTDYPFKPGLWLHIEGKLKTTMIVDEQQVRRYKTEVLAIKFAPLLNDRFSG